MNIQDLPLTEKMYYVGGFVRDELLGIPNDDVDIVVEGMNFETLKSILEPVANRMTAEAVGGTNAVIKAVIGGIEYDFALARTETKVGEGHKGFTLQTGVGILEDLRRRDLTINAIARNVATGQIYDPFNGESDIQNGIARPVSEAFAEDPLRVVRAARFIARFGLQADPSLIRISRRLSPDSLPKERFGIEIVKLFKQATRPSLAFRFLETVGWLHRIAPELAELRGIPQNPTYHPEGDALEHTLHTIDAAAQGDVLTRLTMMVHDLGKAETTIMRNGNWSAPGHEKASVPLAEKLLNRLGLMSEVGRKTLKQVYLLTELHMLHAKASIGDTKLKRRVRKLHDLDLTFDDLAKVCTADASGRPPLPIGEPTSITDMRQRIEDFGGQESFKPIVTGHDLIQIGLEPGPQFGRILKQAQDLQDSGQLTRDNWQTVLGV